MSDSFSRPRATDDPRRVSNDASVSELIGQLAQNTQELIQQEVALAKTEINQATSRAVKAFVKIAAGALVLYAGFMLLLLAAIFGLRQADFSWWASAVIVGGLTLLAGLVLLLAAKSQMKQISLVPRQTLDTLKEDQRWAKGQMQ